MNIEIGKSAAACVTVDDTNMARAVGSGSLDVFATPAMIALMEKAACACLEGTPEEGLTSVGTRIAAEHMAASPVGVVITARAVITGMDGRKIEYEVVAFEGDKQIGKGVHTRFVVHAGKFLAKG